MWSVFNLVYTLCTVSDYPISCTEHFSIKVLRTFRKQPVSPHFSSIPYNKKALPGVDEDCGCSILVARKCAWRSFGGSSSSKISSDLFPALLDSLTRILLWRLRWILWKVWKGKRHFLQFAAALTLFVMWC